VVLHVPVPVGIVCWCSTTAFVVLEAFVSSSWNGDSLLRLIVHILTMPPAGQVGRSDDITYIRNSSEVGTADGTGHYSV
jgi:hypothetical protein